MMSFRSFFLILMYCAASLITCRVQCQNELPNFTVGGNGSKIFSPEGAETFVNILGLFELTGSKFDGESELEAALIAVENVNAAGILGRHKLRLVTNDTQCDPGVAVDTFFHAIFHKKIRAPILLGSACSEATASLANIVPYWNMVQVSYGATSPVLRDRKAFPTFFRVVASDASHNAARLAFIQHFRWHVVTVISQDEKEYTLAVNDLVKMLEMANITCSGTITFGENDFKDQLQQLKNIDTRIIVGSFSPNVAAKIFCTVYELGMFGDDYAWIFPIQQGRNWSVDQAACPAEKIMAVLESAFFVSAFHASESSDLGLSEKDLEKLLAMKNLSVGEYARESYDAVWVAALALQRTLETHSLEIDRFDYGRDDFRKKIFEEMNDLEFNGISGPILFQGADRIGTSAFLQFQGGKMITVAIFSPIGGLNLTCDSCRQIVWPGGQVPIAQRYLQLQIRTISSSVFIAVSVCTALAILLALLLLAFNLYFRKLKYIKLSSPRLNNIAVVGCIAVYLGVFLLGLDHATNPVPTQFPALCTAKVYLFAGGFSLAFGSIFAKTYRIHKIFIRSRGGFVKKKYLQDTQLILLVCALLLIDGLVLTVWVVMDPMDRQLRNMTLQVSATDRSVIYLPQIEVCSCAYLPSWLSLLYGYKGVQLVMGVYMAWETRHVKIPALNDSQYIGISVYGVVITSCIVVVVANVVGERPTVAYMTISVLILTMTTAILCLLFFPKVVTVFSRKEMMDPVMQSVGLTLESNTRRFLVDDSKEKLFRLDVQNRVFKRELLLLRREIRMLEKQLMIPSSPTESSLSQEFASFKVTQDSSEQSPRYSPVKVVTPRPGSPQMKLPRRSWPSEISSAKLAKVCPFRSDQHLEKNMPRPTVLERIRLLIRSKRAELRKMAEQQSDPKRKFSITMCLQAQRQRDSNNIIIDLNVPKEVEQVMCKSREDTQKMHRKLLHQSSYPIILVNVHNPVAEMEPATSLNGIQSEVLEDTIGSKSRSLDDTHVATKEDRY